MNGLQQDTARSSAFGRALAWATGAAILAALAAFLFNALVDPYGANPLRLRFVRPLMDINQRFMFPQVLRSGGFDSAVFGTSTVRLLNPSDLRAAFGGHFANFGINAATPFEQSEAVALYLAHTPELRNLLWGIDTSWCMPNAEDPDRRLTERAFPRWLYHGGGVQTLPHLFNLRTLEIASRVVLNRLGLMKARLPRDGYDVFTPPENAYDLPRAQSHIWGGPPHPVPPVNPPYAPTPEERASWRFPALDRLAATLSKLPAPARLVLIFPPIHVAIEAPPGSLGAAMDAECKRRVAAIAAAHRGLAVDFRFPSEITRNDANYWDPLHYRLPIAKRIVAALSEAASGQSEGSDYRVVAGGP